MWCGEEGKGEECVGFGLDGLEEGEWSFDGEFGMGYGSRDMVLRELRDGFSFGVKRERWECWVRWVCDCILLGV